MNTTVNHTREDRIGRSVADSLKTGTVIDAANASAMVQEEPIDANPIAEAAKQRAVYQQCSENGFQIYTLYVKLPYFDSVAFDPTILTESDVVDDPDLMAQLCLAMNRLGQLQAF